MTPLLQEDYVVDFVEKLAHRMRFLNSTPLREYFHSPDVYVPFTRPTSVSSFGLSTSRN
jgi:hypothetical protein